MNYEHCWEKIKMITYHSHHNRTRHIQPIVPLNKMLWIYMRYLSFPLRIKLLCWFKLHSRLLIMVLVVMCYFWFRLLLDAELCSICSIFLSSITKDLNHTCSVFIWGNDKTCKHIFKLPEIYLERKRLPYSPFPVVFITWPSFIVVVNSILQVRCSPELPLVNNSPSSWVEFSSTLYILRPCISSTVQPSW